MTRKRWRIAAIAFALLVAGSTAGIASASRATATGNAVPPGGTTYALVVGISDYEPCGSGGPDLQFADDDADSFEDALLTTGGESTYSYGVPSGNVTKLLNCAATKSAIMGWLDNAATAGGSFTATASDLTLLFFSGHGARVFDSQCDGGTDGDNETVDNAFVVNTGGGIGYVCDGNLRAKMDAIPGKKAVILDISFPGGFKRDFRGAPNTLLITSAESEAREFEFTSGPCAPGRGRFTCLFVVHGILNQGANSALNPHTYDDADVAGNEIPFEEAFDFAIHNYQGTLAQRPGIVDNAADDVLPGP